MSYAELATELESACRDHDAAFRSQGYCLAVAKANDRIGKVHDRYAEMTGQFWRDGNERLLAELRARAGSLQK